MAYAIVAGILDREDIPQELLDALKSSIEMYQSWKDQDELRIPE